MVKEEENKEVEDEKEKIKQLRDKIKIMRDDKTKDTDEEKQKQKEDTKSAAKKAMVETVLAQGINGGFFFIFLSFVLQCFAWHLIVVVA